MLDETRPWMFRLKEPDGFPAADVRLVENIPATLQAWMAHLAREMLRLGVFFRAAAFMALVPGAAKYESIIYDDHNDDVPDEEHDPVEQLADAETHIVYAVLVECLRRLKAEDLIEKIPVTVKRDERLSAEWVEFLDAQQHCEFAYQNVVAVCLNLLIVKPGMAEINQQGCATWWQKYWAKEIQNK